MTDEEFRDEQTMATMQSANEAAKLAEEARQEAERLRQKQAK
ncbi:hypothetical protein ACIP69_18320 [Streptomyces hygroscopicus]